jgi:hypothetical protein
MGGDDRGTDVWGAKASDWVTHQEPQFLPLYEQAFQRAGWVQASGTSMQGAAQVWRSSSPTIEGPR